MRTAFLLTCIVVVIEGAFCQAGEPLPGQIIIDPDYPQWLKRHGGKNVFICGPGDPEDFLYLGKRNANGTRDGDQMQRIKKLVEHGGNCIYMQIVRSHGGDAKKDFTQNPFIDSDPAKGVDDRILKQWEEWFTLMDRHDILIYLFFYDDGARVWNTGDQVGPDEKKFLETIVRRFKHHKNLIWIVGEESEERYSTKRVQAIAEVIKSADDHGHIIGNHHQSSTTFKAWQPGGAITHFAMQLSETDDTAHRGSIEALKKSAGRYQIIYSESTAMRTDSDGMRKHAWAVAMAGLMPMLLKMDIADTPVETLKQCRYLQSFFECTDFWMMTSRDELKHADTKYVLANSKRSYIAYGDSVAGKLGIKDFLKGEYAITWIDCRSGQIKDVEYRALGGDATFDKPKDIGSECAAWIRPRGAKKAAGTYFPPPESKGGWRKLDNPADIRKLAAMDPDKLAMLKKWLEQSDKRNFAAVVIRNGYIVLEVERGNSSKTHTGTIKSSGKAICACVLAIASEESQHGRTPKKMKFDDRAFNFIPWAKPLSDPRKSKITVNQLFNHTSGLTPESTGAKNIGPWENVLGHVKDPRMAKLAFDPGTDFGYSTHAFYHAALVCEDVTGMPYDKYAIKHLLEPLGVEKWWFEFFDGGAKIGRHPTHAIGLPAREMARVAYCMLHDGRWHERQVIPKWFIDETGAPTHDVKGSKETGRIAESYSHGWELPALRGERGKGIPKRARFKPGSGGQLISFVPELDLIAVRQTGGSGPWEYEEFLRRACDCVSP